MDLEIEIADITVLPEIVELNSRIFAGMYENPTYSLQQYQDKLANVESYILTARNGTALIGDSVAFKRENNWYIWILGIDPSMRKQGIASRLLGMNEAHARSLHLKAVTVKVYNVSPAMQSLLLARNYLVTAVDSSLTNPKYNAVQYSLELA